MPGLVIQGSSKFCSTCGHKMIHVGLPSKELGGHPTIPSSLEPLNSWSVDMVLPGVQQKSSSL